MPASSTRPATTCASRSRASGSRATRRSPRSIPGTVKIGHAFVRQIKQLDPPAGEQANAGLLIKQFGYYFDGLAIGYAVLVKRKSQQGFIQTVGGAEANLKLAEGYARKLGADACTRRPFR